MTMTIGVDPGLSGAIGFLRNGEYVGIEDIPTVLRGSGSVKSEIDAAGMHRAIKSRLDSQETCEVLLERVSAMPGQGVASMFSLGDSFGCCRAVLAVSGLSMHLVPPAVWKKHFKLGRDKEESRALAVRLFPQAPLSLKKHADRAEALLMARFLWETRFK